MESTLGKAIEQFIDSQSGFRKDIDNYKDKNGEFPKDALQVSIRRACSDMMARTLKVQKGKENIDFNGLIEEKLSKIMEDYFTDFYIKDYNDQEKFNDWHSDTCYKVLNEINKKYVDAEYGKAQKIVNMTFKYLYCFASDNERKKFKCCHMPIDSIILDWVKRNLKNDESFKSKKVPSWSKLQGPKDNDDKKHTYMELHDVIIKLVNNIKVKDLGELTPLQAEFIIWPKMKLKLGTEDLLNQLKNFGYDKKWLRKNCPDLEGLDPLCEDLQKIHCILRAMNKNYDY